MEVFIKICTQYCKVSNGKRDTIVSAILRDNVGQLPDGVKAQSMSVYISSQGRGEWIFNPSRLRDKKVGTIVRKFFVKHADSALYAIQRYTNIIHRKYHDSLLCDVRVMHCLKSIPLLVNYGRTYWLMRDTETKTTIASQNCLAFMTRCIIQSCPFSTGVYSHVSTGSWANKSQPMHGI